MMKDARPKTVTKKDPLMNNNPVPLDLARRVCNAYYAGAIDTTADEDMQAALVAHLPEIAACHYREVDESVIERELPVALRYFHPAPGDVAKRIAAALSDAANGGHWEEVAPDQIKVGDRIRVTSEHGDIAEYTVTHVDTSGWVCGHSEDRAPSEPHVWHRWVPADPDAALLAIVDADTLARLRQVAEVTAR